MSYQFITSAKLPTRHGEFDLHVFENQDGQEHVMLMAQRATQVKTKTVWNKMSAA